MTRWVTGGPAITPPASTPAAGLKDAVESAQNAMSSANWRQAIDGWTSVPRHRSGQRGTATAGLKQAQAMLDQASTIDNVQEDFSLRRERLKVQFQDDMVRSNSSYDEGDYRKARENAVTARLRVDRDRGVLPADQYASIDEADRHDARSGGRRRGSSSRSPRTKPSAMRLDPRLPRHATQGDRRSASERSTRACSGSVSLQMELKYDEAIQVLDTVLFIDPNNPAANALRDVISNQPDLPRVLADAAPTRLRVQPLHAGESGSHDSSGDEPERPRPPKSTSGLMAYPEDWPQLSIRRDAAAGFRETEENRRAMSDAWTRPSR